MYRRELLKASRAVIAAPMINGGRFRLFAAKGEYSARAVDLMRRSVVVDMLSSLSLSSSVRGKWLSHPESFTSADLQQFRESGITAFHYSVGLGGPDAYMNTFRFIAGHNSFLAHHSETFKRIDSVDDFGVAKRSGRIGLIIGFQNSEHFRTPDDVLYFYGLGQRVSQLTYNARNLIGNGSTERRDEGLSDLGVAIVKKMNDVGMAVDVSHCGDRTTLDAFEVSKRPVLITHSNCRSLVNGHPRCKSDEAIRAMAKSGGVMGITAVRMFVKADEPTTIANVLDHFDYVARLVGVEYVGVGSDIDLHGYDALPQEEIKAMQSLFKSSYGFREKADVEGLNHPKRMFDLTEGLIARGYSNSDIEGILGGNFQRALRQIWT